jgi:hypothetical protein
MPLTQVQGGMIGSATVTPTNLSQPLTSDTVKTATSTSVDFTGIPSWVKRITVMFSGVSTNGSSAPMVQLGDSGGIESSSYNSGAGGIQSTTANQNTLNTTGFLCVVPVMYGGSATINGIMSFNLLNSNTWVLGGNMTREAGGTTVFFLAGTKTLSDTLDRIRITTVGGTDTFDAGSINILYE